MFVPEDGFSSVQLVGKFIYSLRKEPTAYILRRFLDDSDLRAQKWPKWGTRKNHFETHIRICNYLARTEPTFVQYQIVQRCFVGSYTKDVQVGDKVILITGVANPFLVRGISRSAELIGSLNLASMKDYITLRRPRGAVLFSFTTDEEFTLEDWVLV